MFTVIRYNVQEFRRRAGRLETANVFEFRDEAEARARGLAASKRAVGVRVYRVQGEPTMNLWREPETLDVYGAVPTIYDY